MLAEKTEILLTAHALGELHDPTDRAAIELLLATDADARAAYEEVCAAAEWIRVGLADEPDIGLTAIHVAGIERQLAEMAHADAPVRRRSRRNWGLWGSVAASTAIVSFVMATVAPRVFEASQVGPGNGPGTGGGAGGGGAGQMVVTVLPDTGEQVRTNDDNASATTREIVPAGGGMSPRDFPTLQTSAGGLPWPASISERTGLRQPAFVLPSDFPLAFVPPTPAWPEAASGGSLAVIRSSFARGKLPPASAIRSDDLINAVRYDDVPSDGSPVVAKVESAVCPWNSGHQLVRVTVRTCSNESGGAVGDDVSEIRLPAIVPLIRDLRLAVEVNPSAAAGYRVVGYENPPQGWGQYAGRDDREVLAAGRTFTVLLEVVPVGTPVPGVSPVASRYRMTDPELVLSDELLTVSVQYRQGPSAEPATLELPVSLEARAIELASLEFRAAAGAAALGMALRENDPHESATLGVAEKLLSDANATMPAEDKQMLLDLAHRTRELAEKSD
jgi:hypothetical protein